MPKTFFFPSLTTLIKRGIKFFSEDLWHFDFTELNRLRKSFYQGLQVLFLVSEGFVKDRLLLRASALTYSTLLAIVPLLAFMFALLKGMGVQRRLEPILLERLTISSKEVINQILAYIDRVNVGSLGTIGLSLLVLTILSVLGNIEASFNDIWGIKTQRSYLRKFSDYLSLVVIMPIFFFTALSLTASLKSNLLVSWLLQQPGLGPLIVFLLRCAPYLALWCFFTFFFIFMPNTKVHFGPALLAGIFSGTLWQITQWAYVSFQIGVAGYNAIYGTFAQLPIMMIWIYASWVIVLFGAELSFALQNVEYYRQERESQQINFQSRLELALGILNTIQVAFQQGKNAWNIEHLAHSQHVPIRLMRQVVEELIQVELLTKASQKGEEVFLPNRQLLKLPVSTVLEKLEQNGPNLIPTIKKGSPVFSASRLRWTEKMVLQKAILARRQALKQHWIGGSGKLAEA